jgi:hypothetical protein
MRPPILALGLALALALGCSGGSGDPSGPGPDPEPLPHPQPQDPETPAPNPGVQGRYVLEQINNSAPGQLVTIANPDGVVIGLYRFEATILTLDAVQSFELGLRYSDDKTPFALDDAGDFVPAGPVSQGALPLTFRSAVYGDSFTGVVLDGIVAIQYDFDGDGRPETSFGFRRAD